MTKTGKTKRLRNVIFNKTDGSFFNKIKDKSPSRTIQMSTDEDYDNGNKETAVTRKQMIMMRILISQMMKTIKDVL